MQRYAETAPTSGPCRRCPHFRCRRGGQCSSGSAAHRLGPLRRGPTDRDEYEAAIDHVTGQWNNQPVVNANNRDWANLILQNPTCFGPADRSQAQSHLQMHPTG